MKYQTWLALAAAIGMTLTGCSNMQSASRDTDQSSSSSSGTMRRAESGSNTAPNPQTRTSDCLPGDARTNCDETTTTQPDSQATPDGSPTEAPTSEPETAPVPR